MVLILDGSLPISFQASKSPSIKAYFVVDPETPKIHLLSFVLSRILQIPISIQTLTTMRFLEYIAPVLLAGWATGTVIGITLNLLLFQRCDNFRFKTST